MAESELYKYCLSVVTNRQLKEGEKSLTIGEAHRLALLEEQKIIKIFKRMQFAIVTPLDDHFENPMKKIEELAELAKSINSKK